MPTIEKRVTPHFTEKQRRLAFAAVLEPISKAVEDNSSTPESVVPQSTLLIASADIRYLASIISQLVELLNEKADDDFLPVNRSAFNKATEFLTNAAIVAALRHKRIIPNGFASSDSEGGVRIEWVTPTTSIRLVVPASLDHEPYIYHEVKDAYDTEPATAETLANWLGQIA